MKTMIEREVRKQLHQGMRYIDANVDYILKGVTTYETPGEPTRVDADELKTRLVDLCGGTYGEWNTLAANVCITMTK